jgi:hypothetical protein
MDPRVEDLERHARERDDWVALARKLGGTPISDYMSLSALPGRAEWYDEPPRTRR